MLQRQGQVRRLHTAAAADPTLPVYDFGVRSRVMTCDGHPGTVLAVAEGPYPGTESYNVQLDGGLGGGAYLPGQLQPLAAGHTATGTAAADYPELAQVLAEHPDPARGTRAHTAALHTTAMPSLHHPAPPGFHVRAYFPSYEGEGKETEEVPPGYDDHPDTCNGTDCGRFEERVLKGFDPAHPAHPEPVSQLRYHLSRCGHVALVGDLHTRPDAERRGYASAIMDDLYARHPGTEIDHGMRTVPGQNWWSTYADPDPARSVSASLASANPPPAVAHNAAMAQGDFHAEQENGRARNFHDRMRAYMNVNGGHRIPVPTATGREATEPMSSTCPDCGIALHTDHAADRSGVTDHQGQPAPLRFDTPCDTANPRRAPIGDVAHEPDGQPIEQSIGTPCTGCGTPMGAEQTRHGCQMCTRGDHHSYCCPSLHSSARTASAEMSLGETIVPNHTPGPGPTKPHSSMDNPASSGWASAPDPDQWSSAPLYPLDSRVGASHYPCPGCDESLGNAEDCRTCGSDEHHSNCCNTLCDVCKAPVSQLERRNCAHCDWGGHHSDCCPNRRGGGGGGDDDDGGPDPAPGGASMVPAHRRSDLGLAATLHRADAEATLHDEPEAALPTTDGEINADDADPEALNPMGFNAILAAMHAANPDLDPARAGARGGGRADGDIAAAAQAHLAGLGRTAAYAFTPGQRRELIEEAPQARAANADRLDLTGTHYADMQQMLGDDEEDDGSWLV